MFDPMVSLESYRARLRRKAVRLVKNEVDADDIVQEAFLRWHMSAPGYVRSPEAWLGTVVTRLCIDTLRSRSREQPVDSDSLACMLTSDASPDRRIALECDLAAALGTLVQNTTLDASLALLLREVFDRTYEEIAHTLQRRQDACRQLVHRARAAARDEKRVKFSPRRVSSAAITSFVDALRRYDEPAAMAALCRMSYGSSPH